MLFSKISSLLSEVQEQNELTCQRVGLYPYILHSDWLRARVSQRTWCVIANSRKKNKRIKPQDEEKHDEPMKEILKE